MRGLWPAPAGRSNLTPDRSQAVAAYAESTMRALAAGLRLQTLVAFGLAALFLIRGPVAAYSSLCGSLAVYLPGMLFTVLVGRRIGDDTGAFMRTAALAEVGKLVLTGVLCAAVFKWIEPLRAGAFFTGMIVVLVTGWIGVARAIR